ncbi:hypothetical protein M4B17_22005 [Priestia aryabhattai]|nr:DUF6792 domain-containing protein [Priestia aryabhattai]MDE8675452.1 hypothetical protein [Priestia aryabhattai]
MSEKPLLSNDIRNKITQLEYSGLSGKEKEITRIYKEATGENPPNFKIYSSVEMGIGNKSGFDGAAIHFHDKKHNINEVYYVFRGTEPSKDFGDVVYDVLGIGAGKSTQQINDAKKCISKLKQRLKVLMKNLKGMVMDTP